MEATEPTHRAGKGFTCSLLHEWSWANQEEFADIEAKLFGTAAWIPV